MTKIITEKEIAEGFEKGFDCSMIVFSALAEDVGLTEEQALKTAACFGVGMMQGGVCGAVSGAFMAIGLKYGNTKPGDMATKGLCFAKRDEFVAKFKEKYGDVMCQTLCHGLDLRNPDDMQKANEQKILSEECPKYCKSAIEIAEKIIKG